MFRKLFGRGDKRASDKEGPLVIDLRDADLPEYDGEEFTPDPPPAQRVADRCLCMVAIALKAVAEFNVLKTDEPVEAWQEAVAGLGEWCVGQTFASELDEQERAFLQGTVDETDDDERFDFLVSVEGARVLYWGLGQADLSRHDTPADVYGFATDVGIVDRNLSRIPAMPELRSLDQLLAAEWELTMVHWRFRQFAMDHQPLNFAEVCRDSWWNPGEFPEELLVDGDLRYGDVPIYALDPETFGTAFHVAFHRHRAIRWLIGDNPAYSEVDTGT